MQQLFAIRHAARFVTVFACLLLSVPALAGGKFALVIGNAAYRGADRLTTPVNDAQLMAQRLQAMGFEVALHTDRSRRDFLGDLNAFSREAEGASVVVFYYGGHGFEVGDDNFLMPVDLPASLDRLSTAELRQDGISLRSVRSALAATGAPSRVLFIDACRTAPDRGVGARGMHKEIASHGVVLAWSTAPGSGAVDSMRALGKPIDHSPFAYYLANDLGASQGDIIQVLQQVQEQVSVATGDSQRPWFTSGLIGNLRLGAAAGPVARATRNSGNLAGMQARGVNAPATAAAANVAARDLWDDEMSAIQRARANLDVPTVRTLERRAQRGDSRAAVILGDAYADGNVVHRSSARAIKYYRQAAHAGYVPGYTRMGEALYEGRLLQRDISAAERYLDKASAAGQTRAKLDLAQLKLQRGDNDGAADYLKAIMQAGASTNYLMQQQKKGQQKSVEKAANILLESEGAPTGH